MRHFSEATYVSLKRAVEVAYSMAGGVTLVELLTRVKSPVLSKYASNSEENAKIFIPVDVAMDVDRAAGQPVILQQMADHLGYDLVPKGEGIHTPRRIVDGDSIDVMSEAMDLVRALQSARADGKICNNDRKRILEEVAQLEKELDELKLNLSEG